MDPLTQGVVGALAAQQPVKRSHLLIASLLGFFAGLSPDLDVLLRSDNDPLLALEFHRQFTHSLIFIPIGSFLCALVFYALFIRTGWVRDPLLSFRRIWAYCALGYGSHGLLDSATTYGTQLLWPFSDMRVAWNTISIIDPLFTLPLLVLVLVAVFCRRQGFAYAALLWLLLYSLLGVVQRERAEAVAWELAAARGHAPLRLEAKPSFANILVWKVVYTTDTHFYVDAVKVGLGSHIFNGGAIEKLDIARDFPWLDGQSQQARDIERFRWFSNGYIALSPRDPQKVVDIRYSMIPNEIDGLWGIRLDRQAGLTDHVQYLVNPDRDKADFAKLWSMILN